MELDFLRQAEYKLFESTEKFDVSSLDKVKQNNLFINILNL